MTTTAHEDQYTVAPEPVRQPYDTVAILRRNVADLELALRTQTELKEKAEAELAQARQQKPLTWGTSGELMDILKNPIYSSPAPVPAPAVPELDPMTRLIVSDPKQLKPKKQEPAVPEEWRDVEAQLTLAETEMLNAKAWSAGTQAKRHIDFAMTAICCASALLQSAEVKK